MVRLRGPRDGKRREVSRASVQQHLLFAVLLPTAIAVVLSSAVFVALQWRTTLTDNEHRLRTLAMVVAENCGSSLAFSNPGDAARVLRSLQSEAAVRDAVLFDNAETVFASFRAPSAKAAVPQSPLPPGLYHGKDRLSIYHPVTESGRPYGTLFIRWDLNPWYSEMRTYTGAAIGILAASLAAALLIGRVLQRRLSTPILELAKTASMIAQQRNYALRAGIPPPSELAALAESFNTMLEETQKVQARLSEEIEATRRAEQQLRLITDATPGLISYIDREKRYRFVNRQYTTWFKLEASAILGRTMAEILGQEAFIRLEPHFDRARDGETVEFETEVPYREGGTRWIHAHYIPHRSTTGEINGVFVLVLDVTERRRMEASLATAHAELECHSHTLEVTVAERTARLREAVGELEAFSYSIAHDMRAPLRSMQGFSRLLLEEHAAQLDDAGKSYLQRIVASSDRLDRLIQDVLNYSRVVQHDLRMERVDTQKLLDGIIATYPNLQPPRANIRIESPIPPVNANPAALTQVISNLLGNAVKFVKEGTLPDVRVSALQTVEATPDGEIAWVRLQFSDNGIGIPKDSQKRLFAMFQRLHRPELYEGTGMGLAIVRKAVERMGGRLGVESDEGRGSCFWVELKAEQPT
jgi:PAS domain S-box-containing protein